MGPNLDQQDLAKIETTVKTMDRELTSVEAKVVASMLQVLEGPALSPEVVQKVAEVAKEVEPDVTPETVQSIAILVKGLSTEVSSQKLEVVAEMSKQMGPELSAGEVQMISKMVSNSGLGDISSQDVKVLSEITNVIGGPPALSPAKAEMIALLTKAANEDEAASGSVGGDSNELSDKDAQTIMEVLHEMGPSMTPAEKAEVKVMLQNADASLSDTEAEIALLFLEQLTPRLDVPTVKAAVEAAQANLKPSDAKVPCSIQKLQLEIRAIFWPKCNFTQ